MELTSLVSGMTEFAANLYPLKTEEELVALLSGMHHFPPGVPERARRVHERLPAGSTLCSSDVGVLIDRLDMEGGLLRCLGPVGGGKPSPPPRTPGKAQVWPRASEGTKRSPV